MDKYLLIPVTSEHWFFYQPPRILPFIYHFCKNGLEMQKLQLKSYFNCWLLHLSLLLRKDPELELNTVSITTAGSAPWNGNYWSRSMLKKTGRRSSMKTSWRSWLTENLRTWLFNVCFYIIFWVLTAAIIFRQESFFKITACLKDPKLFLQTPGNQWLLRGNLPLGVWQRRPTNNWIASLFSGTLQLLKALCHFCPHFLHSQHIISWPQQDKRMKIQPRGRWHDFSSHPECQEWIWFRANEIFTFL